MSCERLNKMCEFLCGSVIPVHLVLLNTDIDVFSSLTEKKWVI